MNHRYIAGALLFVCLMFVGLSYTTWLHPEWVGLCASAPNPTQGHCLDHFVLIGIVFPFTELIYLLPLFLLLFFIRADVFKLWWKFAIPFALFALYVISGTSPEGGGGFLSYSRTEYTRFFSVWLLLSSLLLLPLKTWRPHWRAYYTIPAAVILSLLAIDSYYTLGIHFWVITTLEAYGW